MSLLQVASFSHEPCKSFCGQISCAHDVLDTEWQVARAPGGITNLCSRSELESVRSLCRDKQACRERVTRTLDQNAPFVYLHDWKIWVLRNGMPDRPPLRFALAHTVTPVHAARKPALSVS